MMDNRERGRSRDKKQRRHILSEEKDENFHNGSDVRKWEMLAATEVKLSSSKKNSNRNTYDNSSIKRVTRKFHPVVVQNNGKEMYKKVCCAWKSVFFWGGGGGGWALIWSYSKNKEKTKNHNNNKNVQLVLQHWCKTSSLAMLRVLPPTFISGLYPL